MMLHDYHMTVQEEYDDEDDWNPCKAAGVCLSLMANYCEDAIVPLVMPFVREHLQNPQWQWKDAAIVALGMSQLKGYMLLTLVCFPSSQIIASGTNCLVSILKVVKRHPWAGSGVPAQGALGEG